MNHSPFGYFKIYKFSPSALISDNKEDTSAEQTIIKLMREKRRKTILREKEKEKEIRIIWI